MKPGKHQRSKQRWHDFIWNWVHDLAKSFVLPSYTMHELLNQQVSMAGLQYHAIKNKYHNHSIN